MPTIEMLQVPVYGNTLARWCVALAIALLGAAAALAFKRFALARLSRLAARTETAVDDSVRDLVARTHPAAVVIVAIYLGALTLALPPAALRVSRVVLTVATTLQAARWVSTVIDLWLERYRQKHLQTDAAGATTAVAVRFVGKLVAYAVLALVALDNLGVNVTALVAGLGVGGVAVALATQNILGDLFASMSIVVDRPFVIGDFVVVDDFAGTVERIGLKTTRLRSLTGELLVFSNSDLLKSRIRNYKEMAERRVTLNFGVVYQTAASQLEEVPRVVRSAIEAQPLTRFDRAHLKQFGDSALEFEAVYYMLSADYNAHMDARQAVQLAILAAFRDRGIEFAFPTRTLIVEGATERASGLRAVGRVPAERAPAGDGAAE